MFARCWLLLVLVSGAWGLAPVVYRLHPAPQSGPRLYSTQDSCEAAHEWCVALSLQHTGAAEPVAFPLAESAFEPFLSSPAGFRVKDVQDDRWLPYRGRRVKRLPPVFPHDFVQLEAGEALQVQVDLAQAFAFVEGREYQVTLEADPSQTLTFTASSSSGEPWERHQARNSSPLSTKVHCNSTQIGILNTAVANALVGLNASVAYFEESECAAGTSYQEWFGAISEEHYQIVRGSFTNIRLLLSEAGSRHFAIECNPTACSSTVFAYVFPGDASHTINVCTPVFWNAPTALAYNSKPGTLIHEASHFLDVAATLDFAYGQDDCHDLALNSTSEAIANADSHEFFVEFFAGVTPANTACDPCGAQHNRTACLRVPQCGWCEDSSSCRGGGSAGPFTRDLTPCTNWTANNTAASNQADLCASATECFACADRGGCGFCAGTSSCHLGTSDGPRNPALLTCGAWTFEPSECAASGVASVEPLYGLLLLLGVLQVFIF